MAVEELRNDETAARHVKPSHQVRDDNGNCVVLAWQAFDLREGEPYVSINCVERAHEDVRSALSIIRKSLEKKLKISKNAVLTLGNAGRIRETFKPAKVRLLSEPTKSDPSYGALRNLPLQRRAALEKLASLTWAEWKYLRDC